MKAIKNKYKIVYCNEFDNLSESLARKFTFVYASRDNEAMHIIMDKYNIPMNWIVSSSINKMGVE